MERKRLAEFFLVGLWLLVAIIMFVHYSKDNKGIVPVPEKLEIPTIADSQKGKKFHVRKVIVLQGNLFDLTMKDDTRILGKLSVMAVDDSKMKVIDLLNHGTNPQVILRNKQPDGHWIIDFFITQNDEEINLVEWLNNNNLVYK